MRGKTQEVRVISPSAGFQAIRAWAPDQSPGRFTVASRQAEWWSPRLWGRLGSGPAAWCLIMTPRVLYKPFHFLRDL